MEINKYLFQSKQAGAVLANFYMRKTKGEKKIDLETKAFC